MKKKQEQEYTMQDAFIREVDEDLKNESLKKLWDKYGLLITICVVAVLTLAVSYESLKAWYIRRAENWSDAYAVALTLQSQGKYEESSQALSMIIDKKFGSFADLAKMQQINVLLDSGKANEAQDLMSQIIADKSFNAQLRDVATVKLASYKQDSASFQEMATLLSPITSNSKNAWYAFANEMLAMIHVRDGNVEEAKSIFNNLLENNDVSDDVKNRIKDILSVL
ncbi:MAG: tetratricopeptide repeat protein [Rhodospirillales bacterium]|nr:tetratricopeptide repeat protein [Rhodospirillales bacterium]